MRQIKSAIRSLLRIVDRLRRTYPQRRFTLDGRLVGDLGEVLAQAKYDLELLPGLNPRHDARDHSGRNVQIKSTMQSALTFPADHVPDYYLALLILPDGSIDEVFNGPGVIAAKAVARRRHPKTNLHSVTLTALRDLNKRVPTRSRIAPRRGA